MHRLEPIPDLDPHAVPQAPSVGPGSEPLPPSIDGVVTRRLITHPDHRGWLTQLVDAEDPFWAEPIVWSYVSAVAPGRIKGWGRHRTYADRYAVIQGDLRVVLYDGRPQSPTLGCLDVLRFGRGVGGLVRIPPGVWHADHNHGSTEALIVNHPTRRFDAAEPDKETIDPHSGVIPFDWTLRDG